MNKKIIIFCAIIAIITIIAGTALYQEKIPVIITVDNDVREMTENWKEDTTALIMDSEFKKHDYSITKILKFNSSLSQNMSEKEITEQIKVDLANSVTNNKGIVILFTRSLPGDFLSFEKNGTFYIIMTYSTWGKNLDKSLFPDDKEREAYSKIDRMLYENIVHGVLNEGVSRLDF